jgi:hypothetical protein
MLLFMAGCSSMATIYKKDGTIVEAEIKRSDAKYIYVRHSGKKEYREEVKLSPEGKPQEVELISNTTGSCLARKKLTYDENGKIRTIEVDMGADGTVDKRKTYVWGDDGKLLKWEGDADAEASMYLEVVGESQVYAGAIERTQIKDIDHPGDEIALISGSLSVAGSVVFIITYLGWQDCKADHDENNNCMVEGVTASFIGIPCIAIAGVLIIPAIMGVVAWAGSRSAAAPPEEPSGPKITPVALSDGERTYWGLGMSWSW